MPDTTSFERAFSPDAFRAHGHALIDALADYIAAAARGNKMPVLPWVEPEQMLERWPQTFPAAPAQDLDHLLARVLDEANHLHHPNYMGHQVPGPLPMGALCDMVASILNNGMAVYEMGPHGVAMERAIIKWMGGLVGFGSACDGVITSGGSLGNLTALLAMRRVTQDRLDGKSPAVLVSDQAHYSVKRAVKVMGWGEDAAIAVPCDDAFRMRVEALPEAVKQAEARGRRVVCVVGSACTTPTGTYDPLARIADFCGAHELWFHVDAAHGGPAGLSGKYRHLLDGCARADSVVFDAHKMLLMPALVTGVIFRDGANSFCTFDDRASYLIDKSPQEEWYNPGHRTMECTKRMMCLKVYAALMCYGTKFFADYVTRQYDLAKTFARMVRDTSGFELAIEPDANIVCFRYAPAGVIALDDLNAAIRKHIVESGAFYIVQARLPKGHFLRVTLLNPLAGETHLASLLDCVRATGNELLAASRSHT
ncbi:MAG: aminotransferase class I/II-fold pyridoxal phosphate-dependent enzyme [Candidatus Hydrogenedentes bacterium]|nr:aminotransferase class I/II-fold pyridoxal phosphate-dependent enzyme [Candidatus Hydrogenedentota bacterium]